MSIKYGAYRNCDLNFLPTNGSQNF